MTSLIRRPTIVESVGDLEGRDERVERLHALGL